MLYDTKRMREIANEIITIGNSCQSEIDKIWQIFSIEMANDWVGPTYDAAKAKFEKYKLEMDTLAKIISYEIPNGIQVSADNYDAADRNIINNI